MKSDPTNSPSDSLARPDFPSQWPQLAEKLKGYVGQTAFKRWFLDAFLEEDEAGNPLLVVRTDTHQLWLEMNYEDEIRAAAADVLGLSASLRIVVMKSAPAEEAVAARAPEKASPEEVVRQTLTASSHLSDATSRRLKKLGLNPEFTFASFVVGDNNRFAHAACRAVSEGAFGGYNPLFIHGKAGLGKTHLMCALAREYITQHPESKVVFTTAENFTNEFINALRNSTLECFRKKYRTLDMLLLDEVQFLRGKEKSQEEFFHTFNTLINSQTRIVLSSDQPAMDIQTFAPRLVSRFESGLTVALQPPGFETRVAILRRKMELWKVTLDDAVVCHIAELIKSNVRRLEGALTNVASHSFLHSEVLTLEKVDEILADIVRDEASKRVTIDSIQRATADFFDIRLEDMLSKARPARIAFPRQVAMYLCRELTKHCLKEIGEDFGRRDHGTVIHACKKVRVEMAKDPEVAAAVSKLTSLLTP